jgi:hypothetical protein
MDRPNTPISNPNVPITNALETKLSEILFLTPIPSISNGMDERFPTEPTNEEMERIVLQFHYLEQIRHLESSVRRLEEVTKDHVVREVLTLYEISSGRMKAGGLMDDWERNI